MISYLICVFFGHKIDYVVEKHIATHESRTRFDSCDLIEWEDKYYKCIRCGLRYD